MWNRSGFAVLSAVYSLAVIIALGLSVVMVKVMFMYYQMRFNLFFFLGGFQADFVKSSIIIYF